MNEKVEELLELPIYYRIGILAGVMVLILGAYYMLLYQDVGTEIAEHKTQIETLELEVAEKRGIVANLPKFKEEVQRLDVELGRALTELPDKKEIDELLARISDCARDAGLEINLFEPQPEQLRDFYAEVPVRIQISGGYHQVATFFDEVGRLERIVNMTEFNLDKPVVKDGVLRLTTSAVATSFRFLEESERPDPSDKKKSKRRRRKSKA